MKKTLSIMLVAGALATSAFAQAAKQEAPAAQDKTAAKQADEKHAISPMEKIPAYETLTKMKGEWIGSTQDGKHSSKMQYRVMSGGSAFVIMMDEGSAHEMITVIHPDGKSLMATHYCAARNQPRMRLTSQTDPKVLHFDFVDVTNVSSPDDGYMKALTITIVDDNHHYQDWTWTEKGKDISSRFTVKRASATTASK